MAADVRAQGRCGARWLMGVVCWSLVGAAVGCGGRARGVEGWAGSGGAAGGAAGGGGAGAGGDEVVLVVPVVPLEESSFSVTLKETETGFEQFLGHIGMAFGDGYPQTVRLRWEPESILREDGRFWAVTDGFSLTGVSAESEAVGATLVDDESFELRVSEVGRFSVWLEGNWMPESEDAPAARAFSVEVGVEVRRIERVSWHACISSTMRVVENAPFRFSSLQPHNEHGPWFVPVNAHPSSSVEVTVHAAPGTTLRADDGIGSLVATGPEQIISVRAQGAEIGSFELVHLSSVDGLSARFHFGAPWQDGTTELYSRAMALAPRSGGTPGYIAVAPKLSVDGVEVCSVELPEWFEVRTGTPATCTPNAEVGCSDACDLSALPVVVLAENAGTCELSVTGPELNGGLGLSEELTVELVSQE